MRFAFKEALKEIYRISKRRRKKNLILLILLIIIILGVAINLSSNILWGYGTLYSPDGFRHFARARQMAYGNIKINQMWDDPQHYDLYPPGFHIFIASFMILTGDFDTFSVSIIYRILFSISISIIVFLVGRKINDYVGLLSVFFYNTFFFISTYVGRIGRVIYTNPYPHIVSHQSYLATYLITHLLVFLTLLIYIQFINSSLRDEIKFGFLFIIIAIVHGISHITTFIGFLANFGLLFVLMIIYNMMKKNWVLVFKNIKLLLLSFLSLSLVFFFYYYPIFDEIIAQKYNLSAYLSQILPEKFIHMMPQIFTGLMFLSIILILLLYFIHISGKINFSHRFLVSLSRRFIVLITPIYPLLYASILFFVTKNPNHYNYSGFQLVNGIFPTYIPQTYNFISFYSLVIGFAMFIISFISVFFALRSRNKLSLHFILIFLVFYIVWYLFAVPIHYYADRIIYFMYVLPFVYAMGAFYFFKKIHIFKNIKLEKISKMSVISLFIILVLFTNIMTQINADPVIREEMNINNHLRIGVNNPPATSWTMTIVVNTYTNKNEYILASMLVGEAIAGTTHIKPPTLQYNIMVKDHKNWSLRHKAFFGGDESRKKFFNQYDARYLIVGIMDVTTGGEIPGQLAPIRNYDSSPHLILIYAKGDGERIYLWIN